MAGLERHGRESCPVCVPHRPWRLTRRGWFVLALLIAVVAITATWWAFTTGQKSQCEWFKQHGTAEQIRAYCTSR